MSQNKPYIAAPEAKKGVLRWAVGSPNELRSATWRFWCQKNGDFYLSMPAAGGIVKASFHSDGNCQIGHTSEYWKQRMMENAGRHWNKWKLPNEELARATQILVPSTELRRFEEKLPEQMVWIPSPSSNSMNVISIFICTNYVEELWPAAPEGALPIGTMNAGGRTAWVVYKEQAVPEKLAELTMKGRDLVANLPGAEEVLKTSEPRGCICAQNNGDGGQFLLEVASPQ